MVKVLLLKQHYARCQRAVLSNITFTIFAVLNVQSPLNVFKLLSFFSIYICFFLLYVVVVVVFFFEYNKSWTSVNSILLRYNGVSREGMTVLEQPTHFQGHPGSGSYCRRGLSTKSRPLEFYPGLT